MLIFILPSAFYLKLVKKESMKSMQKIGVRIKRKTRYGFFLSSVQCKRKCERSKILNVTHPIIPGHRLPATGLRGHGRQHEPHHPGLDPQCYSRRRGTRRRTLKVLLSRRKDAFSAGLLASAKKTQKKQPRSNPSVKDKSKHKNSHDAQLFDPLSCKTMPFRENVPELCTVPCHQPHRWCFTCIFIFSFYCNFARFYYFFFLLVFL